MSASNHVHIQVLSICDCDPVRSQMKLILSNDRELSGSNRVRRKARRWVGPAVRRFSCPFWSHEAAACWMQRPLQA